METLTEMLNRITSQKFDYQIEDKDILTQTTDEETLYPHLEGQPIKKEIEIDHIADEPQLCTPKMFFEKYKNADTLTMIRLKTDLHSVLNDILWLQESGNENTSWGIDFVDSLNSLSTRI